MNALSRCGGGARCATVLFSVLMAGVIGCGSAHAVNVTWIGGDGTWADGLVNDPNWNPADEPDPDDTAIFNTSDVVQMGSDNSILALTMSGGADLFTDGFDLGVNGLVQLSGASTSFTVGQNGSVLTADGVTINNLANVELTGGTITINKEAGNGLMDINTGGELAGHGLLSMTDAVAAGTTLIINDGAITAQRDPLLVFGAPQVGTLTINASDIDAGIDLDGVGAGEDGVVNVRRNQTLDLNIPLADAFGGVINL